METSPKAPRSGVVYTWDLKWLPYHYTKVYVCTIQLLGAFGKAFMRTSSRLFPIRCCSVDSAAASLDTAASVTCTQRAKLECQYGIKAHKTRYDMVFLDQIPYRHSSWTLWER